MATIQKQPEDTFKISQLRDIQNLDDQDLLLVSDYEGGKCYTRKMNVGRFMTELSERIKTNPALKAAVDESVAEAMVTPGTAVEETISEKVEEQINEMILDASAGDEE